MSDLERDCLRMLRIFGPCSNAEVARRLKMPLHCTYRAIYRLVETGMASHPKLQEWRITELGQEVFDLSAAKPLSLWEG